MFPLVDLAKRSATCSIQNKEIILVSSYLVAITPENMLLLAFLEYKNWKIKFGKC